MSRAVICKKKATLDDSLRARAKQNTKLTHTFCQDLTTIKSPSRERCASTFIPRIAEGLNETAQARAITQDLGTFTVPIFQPLPLKELNERNMPKPDLLEELKDARKRYEKHGLKMLETLSVEFLSFFPSFSGGSQDSTSAMRLLVPRQIASKAHLGARDQRSRGFWSLGSDTM